jgi:hypothetical protein
MITTRTPIPIRIIPPKISVPFPKISPRRDPAKSPIIDRKKATIPIAMMDRNIGIFNKIRLNPTGKTSILVANDKSTRLRLVEGS